MRVNNRVKWITMISIFILLLQCQTICFQQFIVRNSKIFLVKVRFCPECGKEINNIIDVYCVSCDKKYEQGFDDVLREFMPESEMKHYSIYHFFVDKKFNDKILLVGFIQAESEEQAKETYLLNTHPNDNDKREFVKGYLSVIECSKKDFKTTELLKVIEKNKIELDIWI